MNAQQPSNPGIHPRSRTDARIAQEIDKAKPSLPVGAFSKPLPGGTSIVIDKRGGRGKCAVNHPWKAQAAADGDNVRVKIEPSFIFLGSTVVPTIDGNPITDDPPPALEIANNITRVVYAKIECSLTALEGYVWTGTVDSIAIEFAAALPSNVLSGTYHVKICDVVNGKIDNQSLFTNLTAAFAAQGSGNALLILGRL